MSFTADPNIQVMHCLLPGGASSLSQRDALSGAAAAAAPAGRTQAAESILTSQNTTLFVNIAELDI